MCMRWLGVLRCELFRSCETCSRILHFVLRSFFLFLNVGFATYALSDLGQAYLIFETE